jgi:hypothetical protein
MSHFGGRAVVGHGGAARSIPRRRNQPAGCTRQSNEHKRCAAMWPYPGASFPRGASFHLTPISPLSHPILHWRKMKREDEDVPFDVIPGGNRSPHMQGPPCNRYGDMPCSTGGLGTSYLTPWCLSHSISLLSHLKLGLRF